MADAAVRSTASGSAGGSSGGRPPAAPAPSDQRNFVAKFRDFVNGVISEMKKVTWPDRPQVQSATISIIIFVLILGLLISLLDLFLTSVLIRWIPRLFAGG